MTASPAPAPDAPTNACIRRIAHEFWSNGVEALVLNALVAAWWDGRASGERKRADIWERTAQANWHAACEDIAARDAEIAKLRAALRGLLAFVSERAAHNYYATVDERISAARAALAAERTQDTP